MNDAYVRLTQRMFGEDGDYKDQPMGQIKNFRLYVSCTVKFQTEKTPQQMKMAADHFFNLLCKYFVNRRLFFVEDTVIPL